MILALLSAFFGVAFAQSSSLTTCYQANGCKQPMTNGGCSLKIENGFLKLYGTASGDAVPLWSSTNFKKQSGSFFHRIRPDGLYGLYHNATKALVWHTNIKSEQGSNVTYQLDLNEFKTTGFDREFNEVKVPTGCSLELKQFSVNGNTKTFVKNIWSVSQTFTYTPDQCRRLPTCHEYGYGYPSECICTCYPPSCQGGDGNAWW